MNLAWIAAVLRPHDVAPHPNFTNDAYESDPAAQLAAIVIGGDWARRSSTREKGDDALLYAQKSLHFETIREGAEGLIRHAFSERSSDLARSTALILLACSAEAEMEDYETCDSVLTECLNRAGDSAADRLIQAVLRQQRGMRRRDAGKSFVEDVFEAAYLLEGLKVSDLPTFRLTPGVSESAAECLKKIVYSMKRAAWSITPMEHDQELPFADFPSYMERVRRPLSDRLLRNYADRASIYSRYTRDRFKRLFEGSPTVVIGQGEPDLFHQALAVELLGHADVYGARKDLALLRLVQHAEGSSSTNIQDALRLLRQAAATKELALALEKFRAAGPLSALSWDARQILLRRTDYSLLRAPELMVLRAAAELLATSEAEQALAAVLTSLAAGGPPDSPGSRQHITARKGTAWLAAATLSNASGRGEEISALLLSEVTSGNSYDELLDQNVAKALRALSWEYVPASAKEGWGRWLAGRGGQQYRHTAEIISIELGHPLANTPPLEGLNEIAVRLNSSLSEGGERLSTNDVLQTASVLRESLRRTQEAAARQSFSLSARSAAEITALLISEYADARDLWEGLVNFLTDPLVSRIDRTPTFERLARERPEIPRSMRTILESKAEELLTSTGSTVIWDRGISPYPGALMFLASYGLIGDSQLLASLAELSGSQDVEARRQAARALASVATDGNQSWLLPFSLQMSHESDTTIKANAARVLARISANTSELSKVATQRLVQLLRDEDGLLVPYYVLRELRDLRGLPPTVVEAVEELAQDHPSRQVRKTASSWLTPTR